MATPHPGRVRFEGSQPILRFENMQTALRFYVGVLGFENASWGTEDFTSISRDCASVYLCRGDQGRGGAWIWIGVEPLTLDLEDAERRYHREPSHNLTPERIYERQWALTVLQRSMERLRAESPNETRFDRLQVFLTGEPAEAYRHVAEELRMSEGALKVAVHRLRRRYAELLREEIAQTVATPKEIKAELNHLLLAVSL